MSHPSPKHPCVPTSPSRDKRNCQKQVPKPVQPVVRPMGPRHRKSLRAAAYVKRLSQRASTKSPLCPHSARHEEIDTSCSSKRATTAPAASSRCAQSPFTNSPVERPESKRTENVSTSRNLARTLLAEIRSTIGRGTGHARREHKGTTQADSPGVEALEGNNEHQDAHLIAFCEDPKHSSQIPSQYESSQQPANPMGSLDSPIRVTDDDELTTISSRLGESNVSRNLVNRIVDLDSNICMPSESSSLSGATYTWRGDPIESASRRSSRSCFIAETISQAESYVDELHKASTDASPLSPRSL